MNPRVSIDPFMHIPECQSAMNTPRYITAVHYTEMLKQWYIKDTNTKPTE